MDFLCRSVLLNYIIACLLVVLSTNAQKECTGGVTCITLNDCKGLYSSLTRTNVAPAVRELLKQLQCGFDKVNPTIPMICCPREFSYDPVSDGQSGVPIAFDRDAALALLPSLECGLDYAGADKIYGGTLTAIDEHPWMALIGYKKPIGSGFYCGGVLISSRYVLTAAHCINGVGLPKSWKLSHVRLGEWNVTSVIDCSKDDCSPAAVDVPVEEIIVHERYNPRDKDQHNDIALLRLAYDVPFSGFVMPICLPTDPSQIRESFEDSIVEVAGWGQTEKSFTSAVKLKVRLPVVRNALCANIYELSSLKISEKQICAGGIDGKDSCKGDSGGPLMAQSSSMPWTVLGVVSYGPTPCGTVGWPAVYTRVTAYIDWILSKLKP